MEQIKYIYYSLLILLSGVMMFSVVKPLVTTEWIATQKPPSAATGDAIASKTASKNKAGQNLFSANCTSCHSISKTLTGPALANVEQRGPWTKRENLVKWVKNPAVFIATNPYAKELSVQFNGQVMPSFSQLSEAEINQIFDYIKAVSETAMAMM